MTTISTFSRDKNLIKIDYDNVGYRYIGIAQNGTADDKPAWKIIRETLSDGNVTISQTYKDYAAWSNRTELEY